VSRTGRKAEQAGMVAVPTGPTARKKIPFGIKIRFLNISRLWKFIQEDLGGILMLGFFLNCSRSLKDFRKI
jgi:hypothetical protein